MDLEMPGVSGWEAAKRIKSNPENLRHPRVSVIGARPRWRAREGTRCGLRRIRYQTGRIRSTGREAAALPASKIDAPARAGDATEQGGPVWVK